MLKLTGKKIIKIKIKFPYLDFCFITGRGGKEGAVEKCTICKGTGMQVSP